MSLTVSITLDDLYAKLGTFLESVVPAGVLVIQLPVDRAPMPSPSPGFVGMRVILQSRIMTNLDRWDVTDVDPAEIEIEQAIKVTMQLDCYGQNSGDWAAILSTVLRDEYAVTALAPVVAPLYADNPKFAPLIDGEEQYERRWIVDAVLEYHPTIATPMQFADTAEAALINVDERYPP